MSERHHGRLEGLLLSVVVIAASGLAIGGFWRVGEISADGTPEECMAVAAAHKDSLAQVVTLAMALVALRRFGPGGQDPPK